MPITIKSAHMKYKNGQGEYVGVNSVSDNATSEQIAAIEAAGETVLDNIPSEYTELSNTVNGIENQLGLYYEINKTISQSDLIQGSYDRYGNVVESNKRIRTENFIRIKKDTTLSFFSGSVINAVMVGEFDGVTGEFIGDEGWHYNGWTKTYEEDKTLIILFKNSSDTALTVNEYDGQTTLISIEEKQIDENSGRIEKNSGEIERAKIDLKNINHGVYTLSEDDFSQGYISASMELVNRDNRICTQPIKVYLGEDLTVTPGTDAARFVYSYYREDGTYIWDSDWKTTEERWRLDYNGYIVITFSTSDGSSAITPSDYDATVSFYTDTYKSEKTGFYAYISDGKHIEFKDKSIFDSNGRCAWRFSGAWIACYNHEYGVTGINFTSLIEILQASNDVLVENGQTWAYLQLDHGIYFDEEKRTFVVHVNNNNVRKEKYKYPIILFTNGKFLAGHLQGQFMYDAASYKIETSSTRGVKNDITKNLLYNARHIRYNRAVPLTLLHISDVHADTAAMTRIMNDISDYDELIDGMICTGDMVLNESGQIASWWNPNIMTCIGNHDSAAFNSTTREYNWTALSMANRDAYYIAPFESNWGITHTTGTSYYYKDYTSSKVRLIVIDAMLYNGSSTSTEATAQTTWLSNLLNDAITNQLHVIIATHAPHDGATAVECSFSKYGQTAMPLWSDCNTPQTVIDTVASAITNGLIFIGYICGHTHQDNIWDAESNGKQLMYCTTCVIVSDQGQWYFDDQHRNTSSDAYNLLTIDTEHKVVKIIRGGGADIDDRMRTRRAISFSYETGEVIGEVL